MRIGKGIFVVIWRQRCYNKNSRGLLFVFHGEGGMDMESRRQFTKENTAAGAGTGVVNNTKVRDNGAKLIFDDPVLCAQFLRGYTNIELLKDVQPEDIEDISERFLPLWQEGRDSDSVKKVKLKDGELFLIAIVEHQSRVHYDMAFKLLRYIVMVLTDYEREEEKKRPGITSTKEFHYPPILPIVYYEGTDRWTAVRNFKKRVYMNDVLGQYIPDFEYIVVPVASYTNGELIEKKDELSLIMLINKLRSSADFKNLKEIPSEYFEELSRKTPRYLLELIGKIIAVFLYRLNVPRGEVERFTDQIRGGEFQMLFDSFEAYDVQETRRVSRAEGRAEGRAESILEQLEEIGNVPEALGKEILEERDLDTLKRWAKLTLRCGSVEEFLLQYREEPQGKTQGKG